MTEKPIMFTESIWEVQEPQVPAEAWGSAPTSPRPNVSPYFSSFRNDTPCSGFAKPK